MFEVDDETFQRDVLEAGKPVIVDFWAPWCGPCRAVEPILADLERAFGDRIGFAKMNLDVAYATASGYGVLSVPTAILFDHGRPEATVVGAWPRKRYEKTFGAWLGV